MTVFTIGHVMTCQISIMYLPGGYMVPQGSGGSSCTFQPVTLFEICCSSKSTTSRHVTENGGVAVRVLWPPTYLPKLARNLKNDPPSRAVQAALLPRLERPIAGQRPQTWCLNMDWPVHRRALLNQLQTARAAPGTAKVALLTSPQCRMFAILSDCSMPRAYSIGRRTPWQ